jgi:S-adenosyl methyltransferase
VLVHARALLTSTPEGVTDYVDADLHDPDRILEAARRTLDFERPIALMLLTILQLLPDDHQPYEIVRRLVDALPDGSYLVQVHRWRPDPSEKDLDRKVAVHGGIAHKP